MPRGRPKGSRNLTSYEKTKVKKIRDALADNNITGFDRLNDAHLLENVSVTSKGEVFVKYAMYGGIMEHVTGAIRNASDEMISKFEKEISEMRYVPVPSRK